MVKFNEKFVNDLKSRLVKSLEDVEPSECYSPDLQVTINETELNLGFNTLGLRIPAIRSRAKLFWQEIKANGFTKDVDTLLAICYHLLETKITDLRVIAFDWAFKVKKHYKTDHFRVFNSWADSFLTSWGSCDSFCVRPFGHFLFTYPEFYPYIKDWARSSNPWLRRASAVAMIYGVRRKEFLEEIFEVADILFFDKDVYVLKGYGWALKEASNVFQKEVFQYVIAKKKSMPRVSLRYAIEKMPSEMKKQLMEK